MPRGSAVVSKSLHALCFGRSSVTPPFLMAALVKECMLRLIEQPTVEDGADPEEVASALNTKRYAICDTSAFKAAMALLQEMPAGVVVDDTAGVPVGRASKTLSIKGKKKV